MKVERNLSHYSSHSLPYCVVDDKGRVIQRCESKKAASNYIKSHIPDHTKGHLKDDYQ